MIGIICAMAVEVQGLKNLMENSKDENYANMVFTTGNIGNTEVVAVECGVGKVNAAMCSQIMIDRYSPKAIINSGVAGGLSKDVKIYDTVIGTEVLQHDMNATALGDPMGEITFNDGGRTYFPCDKAIVDKLEKACGKNVFKGRIASGDIFISEVSQRKKINSTFDALACEMEGGAVGHVCFRNNVPFCVFRVISDDLENNEGEDFSTFCKKASEISISVIHNFLQNY